VVLKIEKFENPPPVKIREGWARCPGEKSSLVLRSVVEPAVCIWSVASHKKEKN